MSKVGDSGEYDSDNRDYHHDRPTLGTLSDDSPIKQTRSLS